MDSDVQRCYAFLYVIERTCLVVLIPRDSNNVLYFASWYEKWKALRETYPRMEERWEARGYAFYPYPTSVEESAICAEPHRYLIFSPDVRSRIDEINFCSASPAAPFFNLQSSPPRFFDFVPLAIMNLFLGMLPQDAYDCGSLSPAPSIRAFSPPPPLHLRGNRKQRSFSARCTSELIHSSMPVMHRSDSSSSSAEDGHLVFSLSMSSGESGSEKRPRSIQSVE